MHKMSDESPYLHASCDANDARMRTCATCNSERYALVTALSAWLKFIFTAISATHNGLPYVQRCRARGEPSPS